MSLTDNKRPVSGVLSPHKNVVDLTIIFSALQQIPRLFQSPKFLSAQRIQSFITIKIEDDVCQQVRVLIQEHYSLTSRPFDRPTNQMTDMKVSREVTLPTICRGRFATKKKLLKNKLMCYQYQTPL